MVSWCDHHGVNRRVFLLPIYAAGARMAEKPTTEALEKNDIVLRDRSFISSLAYTPGSGGYSQQQVWELHVDHLGIRVPDIAVIVDADVDIALERIARRKQKDIGLGGKISGDRGHREKVREQFLDIPKNFESRLRTFVVRNNDAYTDDPEALKKSLEKAGSSIIEFCTDNHII